MICRRGWLRLVSVWMTMRNRLCLREVESEASRDAVHLKQDGEHDYAEMSHAVLQYTMSLTTPRVFCYPAG